MRLQSPATAALLQEWKDDPGAAHDHFSLSFSLCLSFLFSVFLFVCLSFFAKYMHIHTQHMYMCIYIYTSVFIENILDLYVLIICII